MIHQYKLNGYNIVMDANSGAVHSVDEVAYDVIALYTKILERRPGDPGKEDAKRISESEHEKIISETLELHPELMEREKGSPVDGRAEAVAEIKEVLSDIEELIKEGLLFADDIYEPYADKFKEKQSVLKAICLHVAHGCNMDCEYCFAGKGEYSGKSGIMSLEVGKAALDYLVKNSGDRKHLEVDFFGGEPLLNWDVCKELVRYGRELEKKHDKIFNFTLTTNGILIDDDVIDFSNREMGNVVLSLDGRKEVHDRMRKSKVGGGTYDRIIDNFRRLVDSRIAHSKSADMERHNPDEEWSEAESGRRDNDPQYYMRGTYTAYNKDFAADVMAMADLGFKETSIEPVVCDPDAPYALSENDLEELFDQYEKLALEMLEREKRGEGFNFYHYTVDLTGGPCIYKRVSGCGVGTEYLAVTPTGDLFPCHQFVGDDDMLLGNINEGIGRPEVLDIFASGNNIYTRDKCRDCFAKLYCAGGCAANNYHTNGDIDKVYEFGCELHRKRIECALMMQVALDSEE